MFLCLGFDARSSLIAVPLELKFFSLLFESRDIINILLTLFFSVRTVNYGTSFFPRTSRLCRAEKVRFGKSSALELD